VSIFRCGNFIRSLSLCPAPGIYVLRDVGNDVKEARVFFIGLTNGTVVTSPFRVQFGIQGFGITPAGTTGKRRHTAGHHHLLIDVAELPDLEATIPRDDRHIHFDQGETEAVLDLPPGKHTLQLFLGDEGHEPQNPPLFSERITITVQ
jgi:3',5'-cyclic AMP phosphodiesterase CpdA